MEELNKSFRRFSGCAFVRVGTLVWLKKETKRTPTKKGGPGMERSGGRGASYSCPPNNTRTSKGTY